MASIRYLRNLRIVLKERSPKARSKRQTQKSPVESTGLSSGMALVLFVAGEHAQ